MAKDNIHQGHRQRLKDRFLSSGLESFAEHEILELLLYFAIPYKDLNPLAHHLIERHGSLSAVLDADPDALLLTDGVGANAALLLNLVPELLRYYRITKLNPAYTFYDAKNIHDYACDLFLGINHEILYLICLNQHNSIIKVEKIAEGSIDSVNTELRKIVMAALRHKSFNIILLHNHPSGNLKPSSDDISLTNHLAHVLSSLGIGFLDHLIISGENSLSFRDKGLLIKVTNMEGK